jgi:hypothetical protein
MPRGGRPQVSTEKSRALAAKYTMEHCIELMEADPQGVDRLYAIVTRREFTRMNRNPKNKPIAIGASA